VNDIVIDITDEITTHSINNSVYYIAKESTIRHWQAPRQKNKPARTTTIIKKVQHQCFLEIKRSLCLDGKTAFM
jgi:hypothetical protein